MFELARAPLAVDFAGVVLAAFLGRHLRDRIPPASSARRLLKSISQFGWSRHRIPLKKTMRLG